MVARRSLQDLPLVRDGSYAYRDCTGATFGALKVLERQERVLRDITRWRSFCWKCECECGKICYVTSDQFTHVIYPSCGCQHKKHILLCPVMRAIVIDHRINTTKSASQIGEYFQMTKNAVMGILDRAEMCEPKPVTVKREPIMFPPHSECVWADGHPGEPGFQWCCKPVTQTIRSGKIVNSSYCAVHHKVVYITEKEAQRRKQEYIDSQQKVSRAVTSGDGDTPSDDGGDSSPAEIDVAA